MDLFGELFGWDTPPAPKGSLMKKRKIREMLQAILDKLDKLSTETDVENAEKRLAYMTEQLVAAQKLAKKSVDLEREIGTLKNELRHKDETMQLLIAGQQRASEARQQAFLELAT